MRIFLLIRILDIISTYLCMNKYGGWETIEAGPVSAFLITRLGFIGFAISNLLLSYILASFILKTRFRIAVGVFTIINAFVVVSNLLIYILI